MLRKKSIILKSKVVISFFMVLIISILFVESTSAEEPKVTLKESHQYFASGFNGYVWNLLGREDRTEDDNNLMIHAAHTSRMHWGYVGTEINIQRGEWLISRVYSVLNRPKAALYHAQKCLEITLNSDIKGFDLAYAYEAVARAYAATGDRQKAEKYIKLSSEAGNLIEKEEDKELFFSDFNSEPWFGMR